LFRGSEYEQNSLPKAKLEVFVKENDVPHVVDAIVENARGGNMGDGKTCILPVKNTENT